MRAIRSRKWLCVAALTSGFSVSCLIGAFHVARAVDADALWKIVHDKCSIAVQPCLQVEIADRFALLKDLRGVAQVLLIPTDKISGVESPALLDPGTPNFFAHAWEHRDRIQNLLPHPIPRDAISLAVNASNARSQNQLHIHIDCLRRDVRDTLAGVVDQVGRSWAPLPVPIVGHRFDAIRVDGEALSNFNPFLELAKTLADPARDMAERNLDVIGATFAEGPGFIVLSDAAPPTPTGHAGGEDIQDHDCAVAEE